MVKVKNKSKDLRKFRDRFLGKDIIVTPGESVETKTPPTSSEIWEIISTEKSNEEVTSSKKSNKREVKDK